MKEEVQHYLGIMPYNFPGGPEDQSSGTYLRVREALIRMKNGTIPRSAIAIFPQERGLGIQMAGYFRRSVEDVLRIAPKEVIGRTETWGTAQDIAAIIGWAKAYQLCTIRSPTPPCIHFVTDPLHMRRVRLVWRRLGPKGWGARFHEASDHVRSKNERRYYEPLAYAKYWLTVWKWFYL